MLLLHCKLLRVLGFCSAYLCISEAEMCQEGFSRSFWVGLMKQLTVGTVDLSLLKKSVFEEDWEVGFFLCLSKRERCFFNYAWLFSYITEAMWSMIWESPLPQKNPSLVPEILLLKVYFPSTWKRTLKKTLPLILILLVKN